MRIAGESGLPVVKNMGLTKAEPTAQSAKEGPLVAAGDECVDDGAGDQAEVSGVGWDVDLGHAAEDSVEEERGGAFEPAFPASVSSLGVDDVVSLVGFGDHVGDQFGRVLEIGVDDDRFLAAAVFETREDGELMAEVSAEAQNLDARVVVGELGEDFCAVVAAAVVDEDDFTAGQRIEHVAEALMEFAETFLLVVDGNDDGELASLFGQVDLRELATLFVAASICSRRAGGKAEGERGGFGPFVEFPNA